jgi:hypothetical protein
VCPPAHNKQIPVNHEEHEGHEDKSYLVCFVFFVNFVVEKQRNRFVVIRAFDPSRFTLKRRKKPGTTAGFDQSDRHYSVCSNPRVAKNSCRNWPPNPLCSPMCTSV